MDKDEPAAQHAAATLQGEGLVAVAMAGDVTRPDDSRQAVERMRDEWGSVDICINNAGIAFHVLAEEMMPQQWQQIIDVNLTGVFLVAQACGRAMIAQQRGSIVNIASMSGLIVNYPQAQSAYNVSKAGVIMLTKSLASEWARYNIRVNAIAPGYMRTDLTAPYFQDAEMVRQWVEPTPMRRPGQPEELAGAAVYLASDAASFTTGHVLVVDGGYTVR